MSKFPKNYKIIAKKFGKYKNTLYICIIINKQTKQIMKKLNTPVCKAIAIEILRNYNSCPNNGEMPYIEGFNEDASATWADGFEALGREKAHKLIDTFIECLEANTTLPIHVSKAIAIAILRNFNSCPDNGEMPYIEGWNDDETAVWSDGFDALGREKAHKLIDTFIECL